MYSHAMNSAKGAKLGTTTIMTENDATKLRAGKPGQRLIPKCKETCSLPDIAARAEFWSAPSIVLRSLVNLRS